MEKRKHILSMLLLVASCLFSINAFAEGVEIDGIYYNLVTKIKQAEVTKNPNKYTGTVNIPETVSYNDVTYSVTSIGNTAFYSCFGLTSVTIPNSVTSIGGAAFSSCSGLTSVTIPNSVTSIGGSAFYGCSGLTSVTIPNSVTSIGDYAFYSCSGLTSVTIPNSVISIGDHAFYNCSGLTSVTIPNSVTSIENFAFEGCSGLTSVTIPNSVTSIGTRAFYECGGLTSVNIGNGVKSIGSDAFADCAELTDVYCYAESVPTTQSDAFDGSYTEYATLHVPATSIEQYKNTIPWNKFGTLLPLDESVPDRIQIDGIYYNLVTEINEAEVTENPNEYTGKVNIPETVTYNDVTYSVTSIGYRAFIGCSGLTSVTIPNSVTSIGSWAFNSCSGLTSVTIGNSVTSIGNFAFDYCYGLKKVIVPDIAAWCGIAFVGPYSNPLIYAGHLYSDETTEITNLIIPNSVTSIGSWAFINCSGLTSVTIPNSVTSIGDFAFNDCSGLTSVNIGNSVTSIGICAFYGCSGLTFVTIPNSVTSIGEEAFSSCSGLTFVTIPNSVTSIGSAAFGGCSSLTSVTIPNSVTSIGAHAFRGCSGLTSVTIPNSVTSIGAHAFRGCSGLTSVTIGNSVKEIGSSAFADCAELTDVYCYAESVPSTDSDAFAYSNYENATLHVPAASIEQYKATKPWSNFGTIVPLTDEDAIAEVQAVPVLIQTQGNTITVEGAEAGTEIILYSTNGVQLDSVITTTGVASLNTSRLSGSVAIIKIGNKTVKVLVKQ